MRTKERNLFILNKSLIEEFRYLDAVVKLSDTVIFRPFIVFKYNDILYFLVPDWEVDSCASTSDAILSAASDSALKFFKEWYNTCVLNFSTSDLTVDATDSACVDTDSRPLCNVSANSHIRAKDRIEGVININKNTASKLSKWSSHSCHDRCGNVDFVL